MPRQRWTTSLASTCRCVLACLATGSLLGALHVQSVQGTCRVLVLSPASCSLLLAPLPSCCCFHTGKSRRGSLQPAPNPLPSPQNRYLIILYYNATRHKQKLGLKDQEAELRRMQEKHGVDGEQHPAPKK